MGAILLNGAHVGAGSIVAAGTLLVEGQKVPPRSLVMGSPGKVKRLLTQTRGRRHPDATRTATSATASTTWSK